MVITKVGDILRYNGGAVALEINNRRIKHKTCVVFTVLNADEDNYDYWLRNLGDTAAVGDTTANFKIIGTSHLLRLIVYPWK